MSSLLVKLTKMKRDITEKLVSVTEKSLGKTALEYH
jgi:hypothetical protein